MKCECGQEVAPDSVWCECGRFVDRQRVVPDDVVPPPPPPAPPGPGLDPASPGSSAPPTPEAQPCAVDWCPGIVAPGASVCDAYAHRAPTATTRQTPGACELVLPNGTVIDLADGVLMEIGRHSPDPRVAASLAPYDQVGRRQATVVLRGAMVEVTHVGRTNPTFVNDEPAVPAVTAAPPVDVRIGRELHLAVRRKEER